MDNGSAADIVDSAFIERVRAEYARFDVSWNIESAIAEVAA
jgi:hypothetical protein